ncbi:putative 4-hydroxyphenylacetaldehyde oxime monooxygenase [Rosa chinensis]|uniref:Putative 4-hydroxyphenylacetaldehyde oxime monooxygenase n=1 Tax=Rosa chinensis TaxID=74649 RepID=A0A2P6P3M1_ROSCH|nr:putative 4-hydroxyphenylacetaldehyde oxime monooxygenase [Rosa chinensis]
MNQPLNPNDEQVHFDRTNVKAILLDMIKATSDTSAKLIVWSLSELSKHPRIMKNLQEELQTAVGMDRIFLVPHESIEDITINGYDIPKKSRIIVNYWSIGRDPNGWSENVEEFYPERFMNNNIDLWEHDFQLIPFGSGRRGCPGLQLGLTTVRLVVAQLVPCFNWELPTGMLPQDLDLSENLAYQCQKPNTCLPSQLTVLCRLFFFVVI